MAKSQKNPHLTPWLSSQRITGFFEEILTFHPLGITGGKGSFTCWEHAEHIVVTGDK